MELNSLLNLKLYAPVISSIHYCVYIKHIAKNSSLLAINFKLFIWLFLRCVTECSACYFSGRKMVDHPEKEREKVNLR